MTPFLQGFGPSLMTALWGALATFAVTGIAALLARSIPRVRKWLGREGAIVPLVVAFLMSIVASAMMGLFLRHLTWEEMHSLNAGFSIIAGARVDPDGKVLEASGPFRFTGVHSGPGLYAVTLQGRALPDDDIILVNSWSDVKGASASLIVGHSRFLQVQTLINNSAADTGFWFLVMHRGSSP
jgi:hypothetical protein